MFSDLHFRRRKERPLRPRPRGWLWEDIENRADFADDPSSIWYTRGMRRLIFIIALLLAVRWMLSLLPNRHVATAGHAMLTVSIPHETLHPIDLAHWRDTPCLLGRAATEEDLSADRAVFYAGGSARPVDLDLPRCAIYTDEKTGRKLPVIVVQAEAEDAMRMAGYRRLNGEEGVCHLSELELLEGPDDRFK